MREKFGVKSEQVTIAGVNCYILTPDNIPEQNRNRLLVHVHGGGYVFAPGRGRDARSDPDGGLRQVQGDLDRLPHAAGFSVSGRDG